MKKFTERLLTGLLLCLHLLKAHAGLQVTTASLKTAGQKAVIKVTLKNTFPKPITAARATLFTIDAHGKVVELFTRWVIGGKKDKPPLAAEHEATYNFVTAKPFSTTKVTVDRIVLDNGQLANIASDVAIKNADNK